MFIKYLIVFAVGGIICLISQIVIDKTQITPARILVTLIGIGVLLSAFNVSDAVVDAVGAGITAPIVGFGITLANGVKQAIAENGRVRPRRLHPHQHRCHVGGAGMEPGDRLREP